MNHVIVRESDSFRIAGVRKLYQTKAKVYQKLKEIKEKIPETSLGKRMVIINFEIEYQPSDLDLFAGVEVMNYQDIYPETEIAFSEKTAAVIVEEKLVEEGYDDLYRYLNENNWQITGPFYEIYYEDGTVEIKVPVVALYHEDIAKNESLDIPFENDPEAIGKWEYYDSFPSIEQFSAEKTKNTSPTWLKEIYMLPGGKRYWILGWTKGSLLLSVGYPDRTFCCNYEIRSINKDRYMFVSNKVNDTYFRGGKPNIMVFKKIDSKEYTLTEIRIKDPIDFPFETDPKVLGSWKSCDFVDSIESFDCFHPMYPADRHYLLGIRFEEGGKCIKYFRNSKLPNYTMDWTLGLIINRKSELSERYEIRTINGRDYLFTEWKSGDYTFGGRKPGFYVLERE